MDVNGAIESVKGLVESSKQFLDKIAGPAAEEFGLAMADQVRLFRAKQQVKIINRAKAFCDKEGVTPKRIPLKMLAPLLDHGSLEEDDEMLDRWASLLASSAADPSSIPPSFVKVLSELSSTEVWFLDAAYRTWSTVNFTDDYSFEGPWFRETGKIAQATYDVLVDNLYRLMLLEPQGAFLAQMKPKARFQLYTRENFRFTAFGRKFVETCSVEKRKTEAPAAGGAHQPASSPQSGKGDVGQQTQATV